MISIDDHEIHHLRLLMNELFGSENFVATLVWEKGRKNDAKLFSVGHEYVVIYARSLEKLRELGTVWREPKPGAQQIWDEYCRLRAVHGNNDRAIECELQNWFRHLPKQHPSKALSRYRRVDKHGPWRDRDISWPGGGGPQYDVIHPIKKLPCDVPEGGWRFATPEAMQEQIRLGLVEFREDHTEPPFRKAHLRPVPEELDDDTTLDAEEEDDPSAVGMQVMGSYIYKQSQTAVKDLRKLMGAKVFDNPKDHEVLARLIRYCGSSSNDGIILDFFAGSCSTAEAVLRLNHEDRGTRRFIMVQLPEPTPESSDARKAGYANIADIGKERIRRVVKTLKREDEGQRPLPTCETSEDLGFRVFALAPSHWQPWEAPPADTSPESYVRALSLFHDPLAGDWRLEDVIYEVILREGYSLTSRIEVVEGLPEATVWRVIDEDKEQSFSICLDDRLTLETTKALELGKDDLFICRDIALSDTEAANLALQCRLKTI